MKHLEDHFLVIASLILTFCVTCLIVEASHPDMYLTAPQIIQRYGYPSESHTVTTEDGYILTMFRIPYGKKSPPQLNKPAVFLQHGLTASAADWIMLGPENSLGFLLADEGYDVWLGNARGNTYSKKHATLSNKNIKFWDFSWHEMGFYDLPAEMDYILNKTGQPNLYYIGMSMGTTMFYVFASTKPEYNSKIRLMISLAPVAYMNHSTSPIIKLDYVERIFLRLLHTIGLGDIAPSGSVTRFLANLCTDKRIEAICEDVFYFAMGYDAKQLNESIVPLIIAHTPAGTSGKSMLHYLQVATSGRFAQWDYGRRNMIKYNQEESPEYRIQDITAPVSLFYGDNDPLGDPLDVHALNRTLPNSVGEYRVPWNEFNHFDFIYATDVKTLVNDKVLSVMKRF